MAASNDLRQMNRRRIVLALLRQGRASRTSLARSAGLSAPTAGRIVEQLLDEHVLAANPPPASTPAPGRLGRPSQWIALDTRRPRFLAVQLGAAHTRLALLPVAPPAEDDWSAQFLTPGALKPWLMEVRRRSTELAGARRLPVILSVPGVVDEASGRSLLSPNIPWLPGTNLRVQLEKALGARVLVVQEIRCLAMGRSILHPGEDDFLLVDFGIGVGAAAILGGAPFRGPQPLSGELGHTRVEGQSRPCGCGARGCLETIINRRALMRTVLGPAAVRSAPGPQPDRWPDVAARIARDGIQPPLAAVLRAAAHVIAGALNTLGIDRVIITGSLAQLPTTVVQRLSDEVNATALWSRFGRVSVQAASRQRLAGMASVALDALVIPPSGG